MAIDARQHWPIHIPMIDVPQRVHDREHLLLWQADGVSHADLDGQPWSITLGQALWVPAGVHHRITVHQNSVLLPMLFGIDENATTLSGPLLTAVDANLRTLFLAYLQLQNSIIRHSGSLARQILSILESSPLTHSHLPRPVSPAACRIAQSLIFNPGDDRSIEQLAASEHTSTRSIERAFKTETGMTLRQWRTWVRMQSAASLLRRHSSIAGVARRVGYQDPSAFGRTFKDFHGLTPRDFRRRFALD